MKNFIALSLIILSLCSCQKEHSGALPGAAVPNQQQTLTLAQARQWANGPAGTGALEKLDINWQNAKTIRTARGNGVIVRLSGQPTLQHYRQGYRQLCLQRDQKTGEIHAVIQEIIPEPIYLQEKRRISARDFTGRINEFDLELKFRKGSIYADGKQIGESRPATHVERTSYLKNEGRLLPLGSPLQEKNVAGYGKLSIAMSIQSCSWYQTSYIDSEGVFTVYSERVCSYSFYDSRDSMKSDQDVQIEDGGGGGGGGGGSYSDPGPPPPSNLPGEEKNKVDPKKIIECFSAVKTEGAAFQVRILVVEPLPGTSFNVGPNSFGHVAIQLSKVNGSQSVTQTIGYYPTGSGLDKLVSPSQIRDNGDIEYQIAASYFTDAASFQKILDFVASPAPQYHFTDNNCARFAYLAARAGNLGVPDPTTSVGLSPSSQAGTRAMTPAGMASALRSQKAASPNGHNISETAGRAPASKGECN